MYLTVTLPLYSQHSCADTKKDCVFYIGTDILAVVKFHITMNIIEHDKCKM